MAPVRREPLALPARRLHVRRLPLLLVSGFMVLLAAGCGEERNAEAGHPPATPSASPSAPGRLVTTGGPVTVLDDGDGTELCLGGFRASYPPQCGGPRLVGWDWSEHTGDFERSEDMRWGEFVVTGRFEPKTQTMTPTEVVPADQFSPSGGGSSDEEDRFASVCPEPDRGWPNPPSATPAAAHRAALQARQLDGYAGAWLDPVPDDSTDRGSVWVLNVRVASDPEATERRLRQLWDGALCVVRAERSLRELIRIQDQYDDVAGVLVTDSDVIAGKVQIEVVWDDGTLQREADERYGDGLVEITSALQPVQD